MVPRDVLAYWYSKSHGEEALLNLEPIQAFFGISNVEDDMIHVTTEDDDESPDVMEWISHLIDLALLPLPHLSDNFALKAGGIHSNPNGSDYVRYVAGNGVFESSFPVLIYSVEDQLAMDAHRIAWRATFDDASSDHSEARQNT